MSNSGNKMSENDVLCLASDPPCLCPPTGSNGKLVAAICRARRSHFDVLDGRIIAKEERASDWIKELRMELLSKDSSSKVVT